VTKRTMENDEALEKALSYQAAGAARTQLHMGGWR